MSGIFSTNQSNSGVSQAKDALPAWSIDEEFFRFGDESNVGLYRDIVETGDLDHVGSQGAAPLALRIGDRDLRAIVYIRRRSEKQQEWGKPTYSRSEFSVIIVYIIIICAFLKQEALNFDQYRSAERDASI